jgi:hypothetical protein
MVTRVTLRPARTDRGWPSKIVRFVAMQIRRGCNAPDADAPDF